MTIRELSKLYYLDREIEMDQRRAAELEAREMSGVGDYSAEIADLWEIITVKQQLCILERRRLERYIASIDDSLLRQIFTLRFVNGLPWGQVAACVGGRCNAQVVKALCSGYLKRTKSDPISKKTRGGEQP